MIDSEIGNFLLIATMCLSGISILVSFPRKHYCVDNKSSLRGAKLCCNPEKVIKKCYELAFFTGLLRQLLRNFLAMTSENDSRGNDIYFYLSTICGISAFFTLVYAFITSDFSLQNVFINSSTLKPLIYKIAGSWSSHEGSMLLWFCLLQIISCCYIFFLEDKHLKFLSIIILSAIQLLFSSFIYFTSNPFNIFSFIPKEGLGLNPMLQDIALSIHPPLLYLGYVSYVVPFTIACAISLIPVIPRLDRGIQKMIDNMDPVVKPRDDINYNIHLLKTFANIGILFTTIGIALGSWWAYRELGWGGFWFFDPVENISLFPWLSGIMLHHSIIVMTKTGRMQNWTIILSIVTFLLVVFSTFLVRSGFITSIHSFAFSPERGMYLLGIFLVMGVGSIGAYTMPSLRGGASAPTKQSSKMRSIFIIFSGLSRRFAPRNDDSVSTQQPHFAMTGIIIGNIFFLLSLIILIYATLYPLVYSLFDDKPVIIGEAFFINNFIIFVVPILFTIGLFTTKSSIRKHLVILTLSLVTTYLISLKVEFGVISILTTIASIFLMLHNIYYFLVKTIYFKQSLKASTASMLLGHCGFALIAFSITMNALLQKELDFTGKIGESAIFDEFKVTLQNIKFAQGKNYYRQIAEFWLEDNKGNITILKPENRLYIVEKGLSQESDIYSYLLYDLYAVLSNIDGDIIHAKIYYKPTMSFIWLGVIITASGFLIGLLNNRKTQYN